MTISVLGQVVSPEGLAQYANSLGVVDDVSYVPAAAFLEHQPLDVPVYFDHDRSWRLGSVKYYERALQRYGLLAVGLLDADVGDLLADGPWYWSDSITCERFGQSLYRGAAVIHELSLVRRTANCQTAPIVWSEGDLSRGTAGEPAMNVMWRGVWSRAAEAIGTRRYRSDPTLPIIDLDPPDEVDAAFADPAGVHRLAGERRRAAELTTSALGPRTYRHAYPGHVGWASWGD